MNRYKPSTYYIDSFDKFIPMLIKKRAIRRYHKRRIKRKALRTLIGWTHEQAIKYAETMCCCSRYCCGHRRKYYGLTIQERRYNV